MKKKFIDIESFDPVPSAIIRYVNDIKHVLNVIPLILSGNIFVLPSVLRFDERSLSRLVKVITEAALLPESNTFLFES